ncbi:hypothetical protein H0O02_02750 [Candidatus Micrarchaeota archaeon]|nr:hypothetical protein [Candidatus Micrarchaeota archaeon]
MLSNLLNAFKSEMKRPEEETKLEEETLKKAASAEDFIKTHSAKEFVEKWAEKKDRDGKRMYTKRGITDFVMLIHQVPGLDTDKKVLKTADGLLTKLKGMDGMQAFMAGWKAKSEGLMKGLASLLKKAA